MTIFAVLINIILFSLHSIPLYCRYLDDVKSLSLPGTYNEKISSLGTSLSGFTRLKSLDLSRNALVTTEVMLSSIFKIQCTLTNFLYIWAEQLITMFTTFHLFWEKSRNNFFVPFSNNNWKWFCLLLPTNSKWPCSLHTCTVLILNVPGEFLWSTVCLLSGMLDVFGWAYM